MSSIDFAGDQFAIKVRCRVWLASAPRTTWAERYDDAHRCDAACRRPSQRVRTRPPGNRGTGDADHTGNFVSCCFIPLLPSLFDERAHQAFGFFTAMRRRDGSDTLLDGVGDRHPLPVVHQRFLRPDRMRAGGENGSDPVLDSGIQLVGVGDAFDEVTFGGLSRVDMAAGEDQFPGFAPADQLAAADRLPCRRADRTALPACRSGRCRRRRACRTTRRSPGPRQGTSR